MIKRNLYVLFAVLSAGIFSKLSTSAILKDPSSEISTENKYGTEFAFLSEWIFPRLSASAIPKDSPLEKDPSSEIATENKYGAEFASCGLENMVGRVLPSVVTIKAVRIVERQLKDPMISGFGPVIFKDLKDFLKQLQPILEEPPSKKKIPSVGTGFFIGDGYIVTNTHVINLADEIIIGYSDQTEEVASLVGQDSLNDIALLRVTSAKNRGIAPISLADSDSAVIGERVIAIGNAFGIGLSATSGIVSAKYRDLNQLLHYPFVEFLQTDVSINRGSSGGPLLNTKGEVIGMLTASVFGVDRNSSGAGFAVPSNTIVSTVEALKKNGRVIRGYIGVNLKRVNADIASAIGLKSPQGALILKVTKGSPADHAGLFAGDVVIRFDGADVKNNRVLSSMLSSAKINSMHDIVVVRKGSEIALKVNVLEAKKYDESKRIAIKGDGDKKTRKEDYASRMLGLYLNNINRETIEMFGFAPDSKGAVVQEVARGSIAEMHGIIVGDLIQQVNQSNVRNKLEFISALREAIRLNRGKVMLFIENSGVQSVVILPLK